MAIRSGGQPANDSRVELCMAPLPTYPRLPAPWTIHTQLAWGVQGIMNRFTALSSQPKIGRCQDRASLHGGDLNLDELWGESCDPGT